MQTFLILRHAKAAQEGFASDKERELTGQGRKDARAIGELARDRGLIPELVLCSTATRARETYTLFAAGCRYQGAVEFLDELYLAPSGTYLEAARRLGGSAERLMVVGHNPGLEALVDELTGQSMSLSTATLAVCELKLDDWTALAADQQGILKATWHPREI